jgi:hypothetical protein
VLGLKRSNARTKKQMTCGDDDGEDKDKRKGGKTEGGTKTKPQTQRKREQRERERERERERGVCHRLRSSNEILIRIYTFIRLHLSSLALRSFENIKLFKEIIINNSHNRVILKSIFPQNIIKYYAFVHVDPENITMFPENKDPQHDLKLH